jgi:hypothetical protein
VLGTALLFAGGAVFAIAERDDPPPTEVLGATQTATSTTTTTVSASGVTGAGAIAPGSGASGAGTSGAVPSGAGVSGASGAVPSDAGASGATTTTPASTVSTGATAPCHAPLLVTKLPADYVAPLAATPDGSWLVRGATGHSLTITAGAAAARPAGVAVQSVDLPTLGTTAAVSTNADGSLLATLSVPGVRCGANVSLLAQGTSDAELRAVLAGLRRDTECSARGFVSTPASQGAELPAAVAATRGKVRAAALACDFEGLAALARENPRFAAEVPGVDLADQWRLADARGTQFMRAVVGLIDLVPRKSEASIRAGAPSWVWPWFAFDDPSTRLVDADFATLDRIFGAGYGARFRGEFRRAALGDLADSYIGGLFVEIRADGVLAAITTR